MKTKKVLFEIILVLFLASIALGGQSLTVNGQPLDSISLLPGQECTIEVVSDDGIPYSSYRVYSAKRPESMTLLEIKPEAGDSASVFDYGGVFELSAGGTGIAPGAHFVFQYQAAEPGQDKIELMDDAWLLLDSVYITIMEPGKEFTYQGRLLDSNEQADGTYDFRFGLYDNIEDGNQVGAIVDRPDVNVIDGYFTVKLDFGAGTFDGNNRWLQIGVRPGEQDDPNEYTTLSPRQQLTPTPYALYAFKGPEYTGLAPVNVNNSSYTIGLNAATSPGDLLTWDGNNWVAQQPAHKNYPSINMQPYLGINFCIALEGVFPSRNAVEPFIGEIMMVGFNFPPRGWALCDGQLLAISQYNALFALLGTTYGGDGRTTFALPDLRGRVPLHPGTGPGLTHRYLGEKSGSETIDR